MPFDKLYLKRKLSFFIIYAKPRCQNEETKESCSFHTLIPILIFHFFALAALSTDMGLLELGFLMPLRR